MFEFFIALFGGLFYGNKFHQEKVELKEADRRIEKMRTQISVLQKKYGASFEFQNEVKRYISSGKHYDDICNLLQEDFRFALGEHWKDIICLPKTEKEVDESDFLYPESHTFWVYHLLLTVRGKLHPTNITSGYSLGNIDCCKQNVRFMECIERRLRTRDIEDVKFVLELEQFSDGSYRTRFNLGYGTMQIEPLCIRPSARLW